MNKFNAFQWNKIVFQEKKRKQSDVMTFIQVMGYVIALGVIVWALINGVI